MNAEFFETLDQLLSPKQPAQIRAAAATAIAAQSAGSSQAGLRRELGCTELGKRVLRRLLVLGSDVATARLVLTALINIAEDQAANDALVQLNVVSRTCDALLDKEARPLISLHSGLLSNVTRSDAGRSAMIVDELAKARTRALLANMRTIPSLLWVANLAANVDGRQLLIGTVDGSAPLEKLLGLLRDKDETRRFAAATALRNCALADDLHTLLLANTSALSAALARFASKTRKPDSDEMSTVPALVREAYNNEDPLTPEPMEEIRHALAEALLLFCKSVQGREAIRVDGVYAVLRDWHLEEESARVTEVIESIVDRTKLMDEESDKEQDVKPIMEEPPHISEISSKD